MFHRYDYEPKIEKKTSKPPKKTKDKPALPAELKKIRTKRILKIVISFLILFSLVISVLYFWGDTLFPFKENQKMYKYILYTILILWPFSFTGFPTKLFDSSFSGTIISTTIKQKVGAYSKGVKTHLYTKNNIVLTILTDEGRTKKITAFSLAANPLGFYTMDNTGKIENHVDKFSVGYRVHKYYGFKPLYVEPTVKHPFRHCIACGTINDAKREDCIECGTTLF